MTIPAFPLQWPVGARLWPLSQAGANPTSCAVEQHKQLAILERRVAASREALPA